MNQPLVSIVTPSFNQGTYIRATIESVLNQDYPKLELIVMDGGSTDETVAILESIHDPRLTWVSEPDNGQSDALNKGMHLAKGDVLSYLNSDDLLLPGVARFCVDYLSTHGETDLIYGDCEYIDQNGQHILTSMGEPFDLPMLLKGHHMIRQPGTFWRRQVYEQVGDFAVDLHYTMDTDYWLRAALIGCRFSYVPGVRSAFRLHKTSKSVSKQTGFLTDWRTMANRIYSHPDLPPGLRALASDTNAFIDWGLAKTWWMGQEYANARPYLRKFLMSNRRSRQLLALTMLIDSYLHTPLTRAIDAVYRRLTDKDILFSERRAI